MCHAPKPSKIAINLSHVKHVNYLFIKSVLKPRELKNLQPHEWVCDNCKATSNETSQNFEDDIRNLNATANVTDTSTNFEKYDKMIFNPLRYENMSKDSDRNDDDMFKTIDIKCEYVTSEQLSQNISNEQADFTLLNLNIRSVNKNFDQFSTC